MNENTLDQFRQEQEDVDKLEGRTHPIEIVVFDMTIFMNNGQQAIKMRSRRPR